MTEKHIITLFRIVCSAVLLAAGIIFSLLLPHLAPYSLIFFILAAAVVGFDVLINAVNGIIHGHMLDENFLMTLGSICAFIVGEYAEGAVILLLYQVGELFQSVAVGKSRNSIASLMNICPDEARLENGETVDPFEVAVGDIILIEPGEKVPLDGVIISGSSSVDTSSLTGEHQPKFISEGEEIISGCVNLSSPLKVRVTKEFSESTVSKILELVENASSRKAKLESFVTRFAKYYTPAVVIAALLVAALPPLFGAELSVWLLRAVMFIVISCPCALVVSVPLSFFGALGGASKIGVLVKGSNYLEALARLDTIIFDKTGTLTEGSFAVTELCPTEYVSEEELLLAAAFSEYHSSHPIALSIKEAAKSEYEPTDDMLYEEISGKGISVKYGEKRLLCGNSELMRDFGFIPSESEGRATAVHIAANHYLGYILLSDKVKESSAEALASLKAAGVKKTVILSGDNESTVLAVANEVKADEFHASLLPTDKVSITEKIINNATGTVAFVGDGVNDAPVLARADIGIAMGALGSDAAIEAADLVIMNDDLSLIARAVKIARRAVRISKQNICFALIVKFIQLILSLIGLGTVWMAVFADVGVLILAIANSMRTLKKEP